jgi:Spy/CpxP family protein refolding chaperone
MKKMIRMTMMVAAMFVAVTTVAKAQDAQQAGGRRGGGRGMNIVSLLKDSLHVSDAVAAKADSIQKSYQSQMQPLMEAARGGDADARTKMGELRTKQNDDIKALLTDEQKAQFDKIMSSMRGRRGGGN